MTARRVVLSLIFAILPGFASADLQLRKQNATADALQRLGPRFGLDFAPDDKGGPHPTAQDMRAAPRTGYGPWLNAELARMT